MQVKDKIVVVTGGGAGIGKALCEAFHRAGAKAVVVADIDDANAARVAQSVNGIAFKCDVAIEADIVRVVTETEKEIGPIDIFCSNAGVLDRSAAQDNVTAASNETWQCGWNVHVMAHVYAARVLLPLMIARGGGYFLHTVSAAGLLSQIGNAVYATTKHAAIGFAEILSITHRDQGIRVSVLCPQGVDTLLLPESARGAESMDGVMSAEECAAAAIKGIEADSFLILPHPQVADYFRKKDVDYDRWLGGMARLRRSMAKSGK